MPQIQIIGQEAVQDRNNQANQQLKRQELVQNAMEKAVQFKQMDQQLKLMAKNTENEVETNRLKRLGDRMSYMSKIMERAADAPTAEMAQNIIKWALQSDGTGITTDMSDPLVAGMIKSFQPSADAQQKLANAGLVKSITSQMVGQPEMGGLFEETGGQEQSISPQQFGGIGEGLISDPNKTSASIVAGATPRRVPQRNTSPIGWSSFSPPGSGLQLENYGEQARGEALKAAARLEAEKIEGKPISDESVKTIADAMSSADALSGTLSSLLNNPRFAQKMGPIAGVSRIGASIFDPEFSGFMSQAKDAFSQYRKIITGAQASMQELSWLAGILGDVEKDSYNTFLVKNLIHAKLTARRLDNRIQAEKAAFRDTSTFDALKGKVNSMIEPIQQQIQDRGLDVNSLLDSLKLSEKDTVIAKGMARGLTYEESLSAYGKWKRSGGK